MGEEIKLLTAKDLYLLRRVFLMGEMSKENELRELTLIEFLQISHNCQIECTLQAKFLLKLT